MDIGLSSVVMEDKRRSCECHTRIFFFYYFILPEIKTLLQKWQIIYNNLFDLPLTTHFE